MGILDRFHKSASSADLKQMETLWNEVERFSRQNNFDAALEPCLSGISLAKASNDPVFQFRFTHQAATCYAHKNQGDHALAYFKDAADLAGKLRNDEALAATLYDWGRVLAVLGRPTEALKQLEPALALMRALKDPEWFQLEQLILRQRQLAKLESMGAEIRTPHKQYATNVRCPKCGGPLTALPPRNYGPMSSVGYKCFKCFPE